MVNMDNANIVLVPEQSATNQINSLSVGLYPFLSGQTLHRSSGDVMIDLDSIQINPLPMLLDWEHSLPIGSITGCRVENHQILAEAIITSYVQNDLAADIISRLRDGIKLGASPTFDLSNADELLLIAGETAAVNGITVAGPCSILYNAQLVGGSISAYPCDDQTRIVMLSRERTRIINHNLLKEKTQMEDEKKLMKCSEEPTTDGESTSYTAQPELEKYIEQFGFDMGVEFFRRGTTFEDAKEEAYAEMKRELEAMKKAKEEAAIVPPEAVAEPEQNKVELNKELAKFAAELETIRKQNLELSKKTDTLMKTVKFGESSPISGDIVSNATTPNSAIYKMATRISTMKK